MSSSATPSGRLAHGRLLVAREREERRQRLDKVRVARRADRAEHRLDRRGARLLGQRVDGRDELGEQRRALLLHEFCKVSHRLFVRLGVAAEASHHFLGRRFRVREGKPLLSPARGARAKSIQSRNNFSKRPRGAENEPGCREARAERRGRSRGRAGAGDSRGICWGWKKRRGGHAQLEDLVEPRGSVSKLRALMLMFNEDSWPLSLQPPRQHTQQCLNMSCAPQCYNALSFIGTMWATITLLVAVRS